MRPDQASKLYGALFRTDRGFGEVTDALYRLAGAAPGAPVAGIFLDRPIDVVIGEGATTLDSVASFTCLATDLPTGAQMDAGDTMVIRSKTYRVLTLQPDEAGKTIIALGA